MPSGRKPAKNPKRIIFPVRQKRIVAIQREIKKVQDRIERLEEAKSRAPLSQEQRIQNLIWEQTGLLHPLGVELWKMQRGKK